MEIISLFLITLVFDLAEILSGEIRCLLLLWAKGLVKFIEHSTVEPRLLEQDPISLGFHPIFPVIYYQLIRTPC